MAEVLDELAPFFQLSEDRMANAVRWKEENQSGVIGYTCNYIPEEIILAGGFLPFRLISKVMQVSEANAHIFNFYCSLGRNCLEMGLKGEFDFLDGIVMTYSCDMMRGLFDIWKANIKHKLSYFLVSPIQNNPDAEEYYIELLNEFIEELGKLRGKKIELAELTAAIKLCNENRRLLKELESHRAGAKPAITGVEFHQVVVASMVTAKTKINQMLSQLLESLPQERPELAKLPRVMISGSGLDNVDVLRLVEDSGLLIVADDLCFGSRYYNAPVEEDGADPVRAIARRYLGKPHCHCKYNLDQNYRGVVQRVKEMKLDGFIFATQKFCELSMFEYPVFKEELEQAGIPVLLLEVENSPVNQTMRTRVEAFAEMLAAKTYK